MQTTSTMPRVVGFKLLVFSLFGISLLVYSRYKWTLEGQSKSLHWDTDDAGQLIRLHGNRLIVSEQLVEEQSYQRAKATDELLSLPDYESLFYKVNILREISNSIIGSPVDPLPGIKNPCWVGSVNASAPYADNPRLSTNNTFNRNFSKVMAKEFQKHVVDRTTWRMRCLPYAMLIGVSKCGTTDLFGRMTSHPDILKPTWKETRFWNRQRIGRLRLAHAIELKFTDFIDFFDLASHTIVNDAYDNIHSEAERHHEKITMEGTPHYLWDYEGWHKIPGNAGLQEPVYLLPHVLHRISPQLKFVVIIRNPTDRLYSQFRMMSRTQPVMKFHQLVTRSLSLWYECLQHNTVRGCAYNATLIPYEYTRPGGMTLRAGMYHIFLEDWLKVYPRKSFHIIKAEDYYKNITAELGSTFRFLDVIPLSKVQYDQIESGQIKNSNANRKHSVSVKMLTETRNILDEFYRPFNERLASLIGNTFMWNGS